MEKRKIVVVDTRTNSNVIIDTDATKVGQLKAALAQKGIDPTGMAMQEGLSKTELPNDDNAYLPHDVPYKGGTTNELVIRLTQQNKKIKSGSMTRTEAFAEIKRLGLADHIQQKYGKNFTQCTTALLVEEIEEAMKGAEEPEQGCTCCADIPNIKAAVTKLATTLYSNGVIDAGELEEVTGLMGEPEDCEESPYTAAEIDAMFKGMN